MLRTRARGGRSPRNGFKTAIACSYPGESGRGMPRTIENADNFREPACRARMDEGRHERKRAQCKRRVSAAKPSDVAQHQAGGCCPRPRRLAGVLELDREGEAGDALPAFVEGPSLLRAGSRAVHVQPRGG